MALSVMAMKCQGWVFLEDCDRRPALSMARMSSSGRWFIRELAHSTFEANGIGDVHNCILTRIKHN